MNDEAYFDGKVVRVFWITMIACGLYALAAWVLTC
jgi:hypothetical protein